MVASAVWIVVRMNSCLFLTKHIATQTVNDRSIQGEGVRKAAGECRLPSALPYLHAELLAQHTFHVCERPFCCNETFYGLLLYHIG